MKSDKCTCFKFTHPISPFQTTSRSDGCQHSSTGISPLRRSAGALPIACDASPFLDGCTLELWLQGSIIVLYTDHRSQVATLASQSCSIARSVEVLAHRPHSSSYTECISLLYAAPELSAGLSFLVGNDKWEGAYIVKIS